jgi:hypothetical protein
VKVAAGILTACLTAAHANAQGLDRAKLDEARSLVAEAAALDSAEAGGRVTRLYATGIRHDLRNDLGKLLKTPGLEPLVREALTAMRRGDGTALLALRDRLVMLERSHGRAD